MVRTQRTKSPNRGTPLCDPSVLISLVGDCIDDPAALASFGGVEAVLQAVQSSTSEGVPESSLTEREEIYGRNEVPAPPMKSFFSLLLGALADPMLIALSVVAVISFVLGFLVPDPEDPSGGWYEGAAILLAVALVSIVSAWNDYDKELKFRVLNAAKSNYPVKVLRNGRPTTVLVNELVVGDVVRLTPGDAIPADGFVTASHDLAIDQSTATGESVPVSKVVVHGDAPARGASLSPRGKRRQSGRGGAGGVGDGVVQTGCMVASGIGEFVITCVGERTQSGQMASRLAAEEDDETPLQEKLGELAKDIGMKGVMAAFLTLAALLITYFIHAQINTAIVDAVSELAVLDTEAFANYTAARPGVTASGFAREFVRAVLIAITIVVVAVPEGLPLAVTLSLAYSVAQMLKDQNLVRKLQACETMGCVTTICSDKTGTLTLNKMTVTEALIGEDAAVEGAGWGDTGSNTRTSRRVSGSNSRSVMAKKGGAVSASEEVSEGFALPPLMDALVQNIAINSTADVAVDMDGDDDDVLTAPGSDDGSGDDGADRKPRTAVVASQGNPTEIALLTALNKSLSAHSATVGGVPVSDTRGSPSRRHSGKSEGGAWAANHVVLRKVAEEHVVRVWPFSSATKFAATLLDDSNVAAVSYGASSAAGAGGRMRLLVKGAPDILLPSCTTVATRGSSKNLSPAGRAAILSNIEALSSRGLRTLLFAHADVDAKKAPNDSDLQPEDLCFDGLLAISDPLRPETRGALQACRSAGIVVRMVTGDNMDTAAEIARQAGVLDGVEGDDGSDSEGSALVKGKAVMSGREFRNLAPDVAMAVLPRLRVLSRATPSDKYLLVEMLRAGGEVVCVTGDGSNDAAALRKADVGLAMGSGTEVAKEASDIVIMDDNFGSIVRAVVWGRSIYTNIRRFLQFQVTVNFAALIITFATAFSQSGPPLTALQLLWVNVIMDSFAALALATEPPSDRFLLKQPADFRTLVTPRMRKHIIVQAVYQVVVLLGLFFALEAQLFFPRSWCTPGVIRNLVFSAFVSCQLFNEVTCRKVEDELNILEGITRAKVFNLIMVVSIVVQVLFVQHGASLTKAQPLNLDQWMFVIGVGSVSVVLSLLARLVPSAPDAQEEEEDEAEVLKKKLAMVRGCGRGICALCGGHGECLAFDCWGVVGWCICYLFSLQAELEIASLKARVVEVADDE